MTSNSNMLRFGPLGDRCVHICVDMQRLFAEDTEWKTPWMERVLPRVVEVVEHHPPRTIFTRFVPADHPGEGSGTWKRYYERWSSMTVKRIGRDMVDLVPALARFTPPARVLNKRVYSPWFRTTLHARLQQASINTLVVTGGETDVCVLSTVFGAVDRGYRVIIATDALCSSTDDTHEALLTVYENRYSQQVEVVTTDVILENWG